MRQKGFQHSSETKRKISLRQKGRPHKLTEGFKEGHGHFKGAEKGWFKTGDPRIKKGSESHQWKGGISENKYPPEFNNTLKLQIRKRDNFTCQLCGTTETEQMKKIGRVLSVNHIDFDKSNCHSSNLNVLCLSCNSFVNHDREKWTAFFKQKHI